MTARICFGRLITSDSRIIPITTMNTGRLMFIPYAHLRTSIDVTRNASVYTPITSNRLVNPRVSMDTSVGDGDACERAYKGVKCHGVDGGYPCEDKVQALLW